MSRSMKAAAAATAVSLALTFGAAAAGLPAGGTQNTVSGQNERFSGRTWQFKNCHSGSMSALSSLTGMTQQELMQKYPQKTPWQIAYKLGKLEDLKKAVFAQHKDFIGMLVENKKISASDAQKMLADLQKRLAAIDGRETVILGKPGFVPKLNDEGRPGYPKG